MFIDKFNALRRGANDIALLIIRLWIANIFLRSGLLKLQSWDTTLSLFETEYNVPILPPDIAATLGATAEITGGILVLLGFMTPLGATILFGVTTIIELFVYPGTNDHYHWLLLLMVLIINGGGRLSIDGLLGDKFIKPYFMSFSTESQ